MSETTTRLVTEAQEGDRRALEELYQRHQGRLLNLIRARMRPALARRVAPEDVLQETLLESSRKIAGFEPDGPAAFYRWLVGIARFKLSEAERAQRAVKRSSEEALVAPVEAGETSLGVRAQRRERAQGLLEALETLPDRQAEAVRLRYLEGVSVEEASRRLGCTGPALKALVTRGLAELAGRIASPTTKS